MTEPPPAMLNEWGQNLLELLEERDMTVPELAEWLRLACCSGRSCKCRKLKAWEIAALMTTRYVDEWPDRFGPRHTNLMADVLEISFDERFDRLVKPLSHRFRMPVHRALFELAETLVPDGLLEHAEPEEAAEVLRRYGVKIPEESKRLLEDERVRRAERESRRREQEEE